MASGLVITGRSLVDQAGQAALDILKARFKGCAASAAPSVSSLRRTDRMRLAGQPSVVGMFSITTASSKVWNTRRPAPTAGYKVSHCKLLVCMYAVRLTLEFITAEICKVS